MPRVVVDSELGDGEVSDTSVEVAPIAESLGDVPVIKNLDAILDPYTAIPTISNTEQEGPQDGTH